MYHIQFCNQILLQLQTFSENQIVRLGDKYGVNKGKEYHIRLGIQRFKTVPVGKMRHQYSDNRVMCTGAHFTDSTGEDHPSAVVLTNYKVTYRKKESYTIGTSVVIDSDDGSCHILPHEQMTTCYSVYSGTNYIITRVKDNPSSCDHLPTRKTLISGEILSQNHVAKVFMSHDEKILLKLKNEIDICQCKHNWETNYSGLYIREEGKCHTVSTRKFPPAAVNLESNQNIKLDYLVFTQENHTRTLYQHLNDGIEKTLGNSIKNFLNMARRTPHLQLFEVQRPLYAVMRGDVISVMKCTEMKMKVKEETEFCTVELQVEDEFGQTLFVNPGSNIVKEEFEKKECEMEGLGNIYLVYNRNNEEVHIYQESRIMMFQHVTGTLRDYIDYFLDKISFANLLDYASFALSGIYDNVIVNARNNFILGGEKYFSAQVGLVNTITHNNRNWKSAANQKIDLLDYISPDQIMDLIVGNIYLQWIYFFLQICGYAGGVAFLSHVLYTTCKKSARCPSLTLNNFKTVNNMETINNRRVAKKILDWSDIDEDVEEGRHMRRRNSSDAKKKNGPRYAYTEDTVMYDEEEPPPPYNPYNNYYNMEEEV